ncbi:MAG: flagellar basal-body rod protein FlgG [bacterium]
MMQSLWVAKTGLDAEQKKMTVISNNLANANTVGFKKSRVVFEDLLYQNVRQVGGQSTQDTQYPSGTYVGTGVRMVAVERMHEQGNLQLTENPLDVAINGRGFFQILQADGSLAYTRNGQFMIDGNGQIAVPSGQLVQPAITIPEAAQSITIGSDGVVSVTLQGQVAATQVGTLQTVDFLNPEGLEPIGQNLYLESTASGAAQAGTPGINGLGGLEQGAVEGSNVNTVEELVKMIETQRSYEMNSKAISTVAEMLQFVNQTL